MMTVCWEMLLVFGCYLTDRIRGHSNVIKTKIEKIIKTSYDGTYAVIGCNAHFLDHYLMSIKLFKN